MAKKEKDIQELDDNSKLSGPATEATESTAAENKPKRSKKNTSTPKDSNAQSSAQTDPVEIDASKIKHSAKVDVPQKPKTVSSKKKAQVNADAPKVAVLPEGDEPQKPKAPKTKKTADDKEDRNVSAAKKAVIAPLTSSSKSQDDSHDELAIGPTSEDELARAEMLEAYREKRNAVFSTMHSDNLISPSSLNVDLPKRIVIPKPAAIQRVLTQDERQRGIVPTKKQPTVIETMLDIVNYSKIDKPKGRITDFSGQVLVSTDLLQGIQAFVTSQAVFEKIFVRLKTYQYFYKLLPEKPEFTEFDKAESKAQEPVPEQKLGASPGADVPPGQKQEDEVEALITELENPIGPLTYPAEHMQDKVNLSMEHTTHHCSRVLELLIEWVNFLDLLDADYVSKRTQSPLKLHLINYFSRLLESDFSVSHELEVMTPDERFMARYDLDDIDILILWFVSALQVHPKFRTVLAQNWEPGTAIFMHPALIMRLICNNQIDRSDAMRRLSPTGKLVETGLLNITQNQFPTMPLFYELRPSEQVVNLLSGTASLSVATAHYAELDYPTMGDEVFLAPSHQKPLNIIKNFLDRPPLDKQINLERQNLNFAPSLGFIVEGLPGSGRSTLVKVIASRLGIPVITVYCSSLASIATMDYEIFMNNLFIDAELLGAAICLRQSSVIMTEERLIAALARNLARRAVVCAICSDIAQNVHALIDPYITFKTRMDANLKDDAQAFWKQHLALPMTENAVVDVAALSERLALQPYQIQKSTKLAYYSTDANANNDVLLTNQALEHATGLQVSKNIGNLAYISDPEISIDEVIVNDETMQKINLIVGSAKNRRRVLYDWGLSKHIRRGTGVIALFDGEPGTGKTHCAEAITKMLGLSLMRINIASMVDKYIGETEKNLTTIFEQARPDMSLLLFDEADSLFTKRTSNVSKSTDRYSNMSVNVLLQLIERYEGVSILTTNLKSAIDPAFERRITYKIYFPMPKKPERKRLWQYMCPPDIITEEPIDYEWLSELEMSGGEIKNAVLTAAYSAATQGRLLNSEILYDAAVSEASAAGRVMKRYEEGEDFF